VTERNGETVVVLSGELDMATAPDLATVLDSVMEDGHEQVVIDLSALSFLDSSGIAVLVTSQHQLIEKKRHLVVRAARPHAMKVFEIAGLVDFLNVETESDGLPAV
jgi:anti-anti-sigma factor